jgi:hypothetical protein
MRRLFAAMMLVGVSVMWTAGAPPALAAFPGANGRIVFDNLFSRSPQIYSVAPTGPVFGS